jgi:hypothetical protein
MHVSSSSCSRCRATCLPRMRRCTAALRAA